jgi:adenine deaminase
MEISENIGHSYGSMNVTLMKRLIDTATKKKPADLLLTGAQVVDVFSGKIERVNVA